MYGKFFASTFSGSMMASGPAVFSVWAYVIAHAVDSKVELNPKLLAAVIGSTAKEMEDAIEALCAPDPDSRSPAEEGRRLVKEGAYQYRVTNHAAYKAIRNEEERREYNRIKKREERARKSVAVAQSVNDIQRQSSVSANTEADTEAEIPTPLRGVTGTAPSAAPAPPPAFDGKNAEALNGKSIVKLAPAWELPESWGVSAEQLGWNPGEVLREAEKFRQYWTEGRGQGTRRSVKGWRQTWSTWLEKAARDKR